MMALASTLNISKVGKRGTKVNITAKKTNKIEKGKRVQIINESRSVKLVSLRTNK